MINSKIIQRTQKLKPKNRIMQPIYKPLENAA